MKTINTGVSAPDIYDQLQLVEDQLRPQLTGNRERDTELLLKACSAQQLSYQCFWYLEHRLINSIPLQGVQS